MVHNSAVESDLNIAFQELINVVWYINHRNLSSRVNYTLNVDFKMCVFERMLKVEEQEVDENLSQT